jgi:hypothetical protein
MFMINNEGDISDEEAEEKEEEETVQHLFGKPINEKEKKKFDEAASKIQKGWAMKKKADAKAKSKVSIVLSTQKNKKESMYERRRK